MEFGINKERYVYLIRHGQSKTNEDGLLGLNQSLSEKGLGQTFAFAESHADIIESIQWVFCSDMNRAIETSLRMFSMHNRITIDRRLREINFGRLEGTAPSLEVAKKIQANPDCIHTEYKGDNLKDRTVEAIRLVHTYSILSDGNLAVVGHDTLFECILHEIGYYKEKGIPFVLWSKQCKIPNCGVVKVPLAMIREYFL